MMEAGLVEPYTSTTLLKLAGLIQRTIGSQGNITLGRQHNLDLHPAADGTCECPRNGGNEREVGVDDVDGVLCLIDGIDIERAHNLRRDAWLTVDDAHHLTTLGASGVRLQVGETGEGASTIVFHATDVLTGRAVPDAHEDSL